MSFGIDTGMAVSAQMLLFHFQCVFKEMIVHGLASMQTFTCFDSQIWGPVEHSKKNRDRTEKETKRRWTPIQGDR